MEIKETIKNSWLYCDNKYATEDSNYKLHAALPIVNFDNYYARIYQLLKKSIEEGVIPGFKILNIGDSSELEKTIGGKDITIDENPNSRLFNNPFTIYLYKDFDAELIASLIKQLEYLMVEVPALTSAHLSIADLELTNHITFRQEKLNGEYIKIAGASEEVLQALKEQSEQSTEYLNLKKACQIQQNYTNRATNSDTDTEEKEKKKENSIRIFFQKNYPYFEKELQSEQINKQFQAACDLLKIDAKNLTEKKTKEEWLAVIKTKYRQAALFYHPDKIAKTRFDDTKEKAQQLFNLTKIASDILENIAQEPAVLDKKKILQQQSYLPEYQYELKDGFVDDPYFYIHKLARSSALSLVIQNWEFERLEEKIIVSISSSTQTAVQLYKPQLKVFQPHGRVEKLMPGYEAFYHLFMANALPRRFDQGHFFMIFGYEDDPLNSAQTWLLKKALTIPEFIGFMDSNDVSHLAVKATKLGLLTIGTNINDVFIYYYNNYPETLYKARLEKWLKNKDFDSKVVAQAILANLQNLNILYDGTLDVLITLDAELRNCILSNKELTLKLSSHYLEHSLLEPSFSEIEPIKNFEDLKNIKLIAIRQLLYGNSSFLLFFSEETLIEIKTVIEKNKNNLPVWLIDEIDLEIEQQDKQKDVLEPSNIECDFQYDYEKPIVAHLYIKQNFISANPNIVYFLNKNALVWLAEQSEIHWSSYLPIIEALLKLNEQVLAKKYTLHLAKELNMDAESKSFNEIYQDILKLESKINIINQQWTQNTINRLLEEYQKFLYNEENGDKQIFIDKLALFNAVNKISAITKQHYILLKDKFYNLLGRLKAGEKSNELKKAFIDLRKIVERTSLCPEQDIEWNDLIERNKDGTFLLGSEIYTLMYQVIDIKDSSAHFWNSAENTISGATYGITHEADFFTKLERLFFIYECLGAASMFYNTLENHTVKSQTQRFTGIASFNKELIIQHLLEYADNEFAVYIRGEREAASYKKHRWIDDQNIKEFAELHFLYERIGQKNHLENYLNNAYQQLMDAEKAYASSAYFSFLDYDDKKPNTNRPLDKYVEIRYYCKTIHSQLEELGVQQGIYLLVKECHESLGSSEKKLARLFNGIKKTYNPEQSETDDRLISVKTKELLKLLAEFLKNYSNKPAYDKLIQKICQDHILKDYFGLTKLDLSKLTDQQLAKALTDTIKKDNHIVSLPAYVNRLTLANAHESKQQIVEENNSEIQQKISCLFGDDKKLSKSDLIKVLQGIELIDQLKLIESAFNSIKANKGLYKPRSKNYFWESYNIEFSSKQLEDIEWLKHIYVTCIQSRTFNAQNPDSAIALKEIIDQSELVDFNRTRFKAFVKEVTLTRKIVNGLLNGNMQINHTSNNHYHLTGWSR